MHRGTGWPGCKGDVNLQIYGWGDFAWKRRDGRNVREARSRAPAGWDASPGRADGSQPHEDGCALAGAERAAILARAPKACRENECFTRNGLAPALGVNLKE